jgi:hypothetical protein
VPIPQSAQGSARLKIAYLGWGSLVWDRRDLPIVGEWIEGGPSLAIEFARVSGDGRLTLVIDEKHGAQVRTRYAQSACTDLTEAIERLRQREGKPARDQIGFVEPASNRERPESRTSHPESCDRIKAWAKTQGWDAVVWTALLGNFPQKRGEAFTTEAAYRYFDGLTGDARARAEKYIENAPQEVDTPFRLLWAARQASG